MSRTVADAIVACLKQEGVEVIFGIPGEENIRLVMALEGSGIRFILTRHEQAAAFMADMYGRLTGRAGVCTATLGPGAINLLLGVADATTDSTPLVALTAQVGLNRIYRESHQSVDLVAMFRPVTKWADIVLTPQSVPEMVRKAFSLACSERPGATYLAIPQDIEAAPAPPRLHTPARNALPRSRPRRRPHRRGRDTPEDCETTRHSRRTRCRPCTRIGCARKAVGSPERARRDDIHGQGGHT
ncbi:thiamine pyrophosphate-binding protein [Tanticharoenia sakaeratensis]|uniref:Thiamine pyrophosphate TPP binding domain-containing protein n=1 Tax=Tanticharoenia sakaeratensis NBRC 103193 TaxID=1231623 RepID=A0A0D6MMY2_9PROT|nr:thiamine pyrophosphate-binding protein [Tanticharoenia sakaeratensis]GAN54658.1 thiamine pyrophosphate TPP binding domain-containing protein [Tanticharoenia sakaeratensis NBRC 103193]GBQ16747.1 hypothetical protein AA103193_0089 [Tanticharoenia sakaeratensis NBRC 103193]